LKNRIKEMYNSSRFATREKKQKRMKKIWSIILTAWSTIWLVLVLLISVWGGSEIFAWWNENFPETFPISINWMRRIIGGEIGAVICLLLIILPMSKRRKR